MEFLKTNQSLLIKEQKDYVKPEILEKIKIIFKIKEKALAGSHCDFAKIINELSRVMKPIEER